MSYPPPTQKDADQVLRYSFDDLNGRIRVDAVISPSGHDLEIHHEDDSIAIGTPTDLFTATTIGPQVGLDVNVINPITVNTNPSITPLVTNIVATLANTEYSFLLPNNTKQFLIKSRGIGKLQFSFVSGTTGSNYITIFPGASYKEKELLLTPTFIYFQNSKAGETVEILSWT